MKQRVSVLIMAALFGVLAALTTVARQVEGWSYERLFKEADLIVIAQPTKTENSADRTRDNPWKIEFVGVNTRFHVDHVMKGDVGPSELTLLHYKTDSVIANGPCLVSFRTSSLTYLIQREGHAGTMVKAAGPATYLLFLKVRPDGRFEPVSGQTDAGFSVREIRMPAPLDMDE